MIEHSALSLYQYHAIAIVNHDQTSIVASLRLAPDRYIRSVLGDGFHILYLAGMCCTSHVHTFGLIFFVALHVHMILRRWILMGFLRLLICQWAAGVWSV